MTGQTLRSDLPEELYLLGEPVHIFSSRRNRLVGTLAGGFVVVIGLLIMGILLIPDLPGNDMCLVQILLVALGGGTAAFGLWLGRFSYRLRNWIAVSEAGIVFIKDGQVQGCHWHDLAGCDVGRGRTRAWLSALGSLGPGGPIPTQIVTTLYLRGKQGAVMAINDDSFGDGIGDIKGLAKYIAEHLPADSAASSPQV